MQKVSTYGVKNKATLRLFLHGLATIVLALIHNTHVLDVNPFTSC